MLKKWVGCVGGGGGDGGCGSGSGSGTGDDGGRLFVVGIQQMAVTVVVVEVTVVMVWANTGSVDDTAVIQTW